MITFIEPGLFSSITKKHVKKAIETPEPEEDLPNRYMFHNGQRIFFTDEAIKEKIYEDYMTLEQLNKLLFIYVKRTNNYPEGRGHTGQWIATSHTGDDWIDAHWFKKFEEPEGIGPFSDIRAVQEAYRHLTIEEQYRRHGIYG